MTRLTPTERLRVIGENADVSGLVDQILDSYVEFLRSTEAPKSELLIRFERGTKRAAGQNFGGLIFELLTRIGAETTLFRYLVV